MTTTPDTPQPPVPMPDPSGPEVPDPVDTPPPGTEGAEPRNLPR